MKVYNFALSADSILAHFKAIKIETAVKDLTKGKLPSGVFLSSGRNRVSLHFSVDMTNEVSLNVFNARGVCVANVNAGAGANNLLWNGTDVAGNRLPSGSYLAKFVINGQVMARRVMLLN
jgi:flagellar hook assembly protein FlgD